MSWFGLFDRFRLRSAATTEGWPMPGSRLRMNESNLAAFYRGLVQSQGPGYTADLYDFASHDLARRWMPRMDRQAAHVDLRLTGRAQRVLFAGDAGHDIVSWFAPEDQTFLRLDGTDLRLRTSGFWALMEETLGIGQIPSLSIWAADPASAAAAINRLAPRLSRETVAILRIPAAMLAQALADLPSWPARCAAALPCTGAADEDGRGEEPADVILCLEGLSQRDPAAEPPALTPIRRDIWNTLDRAMRLSVAPSAMPSGVIVRQPLPDRSLTGGWTLGLVGEAPATPCGRAAAAMQTVPFRAVPGFDHIAEIQGATILLAEGLLLALPQQGPVVIAQAGLREADTATPSADLSGLQEAARGLLLSRGLLEGAGFAASRARPVRRLSARSAFLLGGPCAPGVYISEIWPTLEYLFQVCESERLDLGDIDILIPGNVQPIVRDSLRLLGIRDDRIVTDTDLTLYRHVMMTTPAIDARTAQRSAAFDQFWKRVDGMVRLDAHVSFTRPRRSDRVMLRPSTGPALLNAQALEAIARRWGYDIIEPETVGLSELIAVMAQARCVVGTGPALSWACLARQAALGVLQPDQEPELPFAALHAAAARGLGIAAAFGTSTGQQSRAGFAMAPERFEALLARIGGRGAESRAPGAEALRSGAADVEVVR